MPSSVRDVSRKELEQLVAQQRAENERLKSENELLREKVDLLIRKIHGSSSEKLDPGQLEMLLDPDGAKKPDAAGCDEDAPAAEPGQKPPDKQCEEGRKKRKRSRPKLPADIEVVEKVVIDDEVLADPDSWRYLDEEVSERLQYDPPRFWLERTRRRTYVKRGDADRAPLTAPLAPCLLEGSLLSPSLAAPLLTAKFCDHLPFYRQEQNLALRHEIEISRQTMCHWAMVCAAWVEPLWDLLAAELRAQKWIEVDETPIEYLCPGHGRTKIGYFWTYRHPEVGVLFDWHPSRGHQCLDSVLVDTPGAEAFEGIMVTDGFAAYDTWARKQGGIILAACWAHARRKFHEAAPHHPEEALPVLQLIAELYRVERRLCHQGADPQRRRKVRLEHSRPVVEAIKDHLLRMKSCLPKSTLGQARDYTLGLWERLSVFLEHGEIPIDNNGVENTIRPTALGKKNWLFIGGADTGQRSAILYTMVENIRQGGGNPFAYLREVFERLPAMTNQDDLRPLLPRNWMAKRQAIEVRVA